MNTTAIIAAIIALFAGVAGGTAIQKNSDSEQLQQQTVEMQNQIDTTPIAEDYLSMRPSIEALPTETLSASETAGLLLMREEEKLARDVYQTLYEIWGLNIFTNIAQSEQTHTEAVKDILDKYELTDPVTDDTIGVFQNTDMQELYDTLTAKGAISEIEALTVGAIVEDLDINDLQELLLETDNQDIKLVYDNLLRGSRNHLRSFIKQLDSRDATYEVQYISNSDYETIINNEQEQGNNTSEGDQKGGGRGWGKDNH